MGNRRLALASTVVFVSLLACNLGAPPPASGTPTGNVLTLAAQTLQAQTPTSTAAITVDQALTLAVETLQAQATPTAPTATPPPVSQPKSTKPAKTKKPTATATATSHAGPIGTLFLPPRINLTFVLNPGILSSKLDNTASAKYGEANLSGGFSPDPYTVGMTAGGTVDVSYLGGSCSGFATSAPDLRINFGGGGASLMRIYFIGANGDPAMVVNDPYGNFYCVNDSFGTVNPTIDFNNPAGGAYNVWIASYAANASISGTLYLTENSGNHP